MQISSAELYICLQVSELTRSSHHASDAQKAVGAATSYLRLANGKEVIAHGLASRDLLPAQARNIHDAHDPGRAPFGSLRKEALELVRINVLVPVVRPLGHNPQHILGHEIGREPTRPRARNGAHNQPPTGLDKVAAPVQKISGLVDVLNHFKQADNVVLGFVTARQRQRLNGAADVLQFWGQRWVARGVGPGDLEDFWCGVNGRDGGRGGQAGGGLGENAAAAANVEVAEFAVGWERGGLRGVAGADKVVAERVHEMQDARGAVGVPPLGGQGIEVGNLGGVDRGVGWIR